MTNKELKESLGVIWALVYHATQVPNLDAEQTVKLQRALDVISAGRDGDDYFNRWASHVHSRVHSSGILSVPSRKPHGTKAIMVDCERLQRHLEEK
jgi:hypothetical protein